MANIIKQLTDKLKINKIFPITLTKAVYDEDGNRLDNTLGQIKGCSLGYIDTSNVLYESGGLNKVTTVADYIATENCWLYARPSLYSGCTMVVKIDGVEIMSETDRNTSTTVHGKLLPIKKGQTVSIVFSNTNNGTSYIYYYGMC